MTDQQRRYKRQLGKPKKEQALPIATEEKAYQLRSEQVTTTIENNLKQQFGFVADPKVFSSSQHSNLVLLFTTFSLRISRFHATKTTTKEFALTPGSRTQIYPDTASHKHMDKTGKNNNAKLPRRDPSTLPLRRNYQHFR